MTWSITLIPPEMSMTKACFTLLACVSNIIRYEKPVPKSWTKLEVIARVWAFISNLRYNHSTFILAKSSGTRNPSNWNYKWGTARQNQQNDAHPAKTQISLRIRDHSASALSDHSLLCAQYEVKHPKCLNADSTVQTDQTGPMPDRWPHRSFCWFCHGVA